MRGKGRNEREDAVIRARKRAVFEGDLPPPRGEWAVGSVYGQRRAYYCDTDKDSYVDNAIPTLPLLDWVLTETQTAPGKNVPSVGRRCEFLFFLLQIQGSAVRDNQST